MSQMHPTATSDKHYYGSPRYKHERKYKGKPLYLFRFKEELWSVHVHIFIGFYARLELCWWAWIMLNKTSFRNCIEPDLNARLLRFCKNLHFGHILCMFAVYAVIVCLGMSAWTLRRFTCRAPRPTFPFQRKPNGRRGHMHIRQRQTTVHHSANATIVGVDTGLRLERARPKGP